VVQVSVAEDVTVGLLQAVPPKEAVAPERKPDPLTVIGVLPVIGPDEGVTLVTVGAAKNSTAPILGAVFDRANPLWSNPFTGLALLAVALPAPIAGLPVPRVMVKVWPPLL